MTEFEAQRLCQEVENLLSPPDRARMNQRFALSGMNMATFLDLRIDGVSSSEKDSDSSETISFDAAETARIISRILDLPIGDYTWTFSNYLAAVIRASMDTGAESKPHIEESTNVIGFSKTWSKKSE